MFLNDIGQPLILSANKCYGPYEEHNGPLLITSAAFQDHIVPKNWCGRVIGSSEDVSRIVSKSNVTLKCDILEPYKATEVEYEKTKFTLTLIPAGTSNTNRISTMYYWKNDYITALIVDRWCGCLDFIPKAGASFHRALGDGIDVMYIDDMCYISKDSEVLSERENLYSLVEIIRPKYLYGLRQNELPKCLHNLCAQSIKMANNNKQKEIL